MPKGLGISDTAEHSYMNEFFEVLNNIVSGCLQVNRETGIKNQKSKIKSLISPLKYGVAKVISCKKEAEKDLKS